MDVPTWECIHSYATWYLFNVRCFWPGFFKKTKKNLVRLQKYQTNLASIGFLQTVRVLIISCHHHISSGLTSAPLIPAGGYLKKEGIATCYVYYCALAFNFFSRSDWTKVKQRRLLCIWRRFYHRMFSVILPAVIPGVTTDSLPPPRD